MKQCIDTVPALQTPSTKLAIVSLYRSMLSHSDGRAWLKQENAWQKAIDYCFEDQTIYVVRSATDFLTDYLFSMAEAPFLDEELCLQITREIMRPLEESAYVEHIGNICVDSSDLQCKVLPSINIMRTIFDRYIVVGRTLCIGNQIMKTCKGQRNLWKLLDMTQDAKLFEKIMQCKVHLNYAVLVDTLNARNAAGDNPNGPDNSLSDFNEFGLTFLNNIKICILKNQQTSLLATAKQYYVLWRKMGDRVPEQIMLGNQLTTFENQSILFQLMPLIQMMRRYPGRMVEAYEEYILKLFHISAEHTLRICYSFRDSMTDRNVDCTDISCKAIQSILSMEQYLHRDRAILVFQALCHVLKTFACDMKPDDFAAMVERPAMLTAVVNGLHTLVKKYKITWKESFEAIAVLCLSLAVMEHANLPPRVS